MNEVERWCAFTRHACWGDPKYHDEVSREWFCVDHAGPLAWSGAQFSTVERVVTLARDEYIRMREVA